MDSLHLEDSLQLAAGSFQITLIIVILMAFIFSGCVHSPEVIKDIKTLSQDNLFYLDQDSSDDDLATSDFLKIMDSNYNRRWFLPWHKEMPQYSREDVSWGFEKYSNKPGYGENRRRHTKNWIEALRDLADLQDYPNRNLKAITIRNTNLRVLPTNKPHFSDFEKAGQGYPFDNFQNSAVWANTPVFISHISKDGSWVFVESPFAIGWMPANDIAFVDDAFVRRWEQSEFIALIKDNVPVYDNLFVFRFFAHIGAIFPKADEAFSKENEDISSHLEGEGRCEGSPVKDSDFLECLIAVPASTRKAKIICGKIPKESAITKPLKISRKNIAKVANELIDQPYGWGGMYENRDCSATIRDLFTPFGLWLPRNSTDQAESGIFISLKDLGPSDKEKMIIKNGIPYGTLVWLRGHIMLYIGSSDDRPLVFHNLWGLRTREFLWSEGRKVVGHSAITTLQPGIELSNIDLPRGDLLNRVEGMTLLIPPKVIQAIFNDS